MLVLPGGKANLAFARLVAEESQAQRPLGLDDLLLLNKGDPDNIEKHLVSYIKGFSKNVRDIFEFFEFESEIERMAELFGRDKSVISRHLRNVFESKELEREAVGAKNAATAADSKTYQVDTSTSTPSSATASTRSAAPSSASGRR